MVKITSNLFQVLKATVAQFLKQN